MIVSLPTKSRVQNERRTTLSSLPSSRVSGSGFPPSITHRFVSYFVLMKFSIFLEAFQSPPELRPFGITYASDGTWPGASFASQYMFARLFPQRCIVLTWSVFQESKSTDFTLLMWTPIPRCIPEHLRLSVQSSPDVLEFSTTYLIQTKTPNS